ncbi:MAG: VWA domain-containing protein [Selenomonadaceae bacterium]|nr:VWA domain-containing protein [Selenomonadaceae bacterium]
MKKIFFFVITMFCLCGLISTGECREVVFVVNSSQSMNVSDPFHAVAESVTWGVDNLSADDEVAIVTFNDNASVLRQLTKVDSVPNQIFNLNYSGQSNAGAGLLTAIDILSPKFNTQRDIIFITNGNIQSPQSTNNFKAGLDQAKWLGISVYLVELRHDANPQNYKPYEDHVKFLPVNYKELMTTIRTIIQGDFHSPFITLPTNHLTQGTLNFESPVESARHLKICLLSSNIGKTNLKNFTPDIQGKFINIFEIDSPSTNNFEFEVDYPQGTGLTLDVIPTVPGELKTNTSTQFLTKDILEITPMNSEKKILANKFFDGKSINLVMDSKKVEGKIHDGIIQVPLDDFGENISLQKIHFEDIGIIFYGDDTAKIFAPKNHYVEGLIGFLGLLIIGGLLWRIRNKKQSSKSIDTLATVRGKEKNLPPLEQSSPKNINSVFFYSGKLLIYFTKTPTAEEIAPREFNLFRMNSAQISLAYILQQCNILENFKGAADIFFNPDKNGINVENKSDCTITKRNILVEKGQRVDLYYDDSVNVLTDDESAEMILMYKSFKPV